MYARYTATRSAVPRGCVLTTGNGGRGGRPPASSELERLGRQAEEFDQGTLVTHRVGILGHKRRVPIRASGHLVIE
jgi:hypothetical protein